MLVSNSDFKTEGKVSKLVFFSPSLSTALRSALDLLCLHLQVITNLRIAHVEARHEGDQCLRQYMHVREMEVIPVQQSKELAVVQTDDWRINEVDVEMSDMTALKTSVAALIDDLNMKDPSTLKRQALQAIAKLGYDDLYLVHNLRKRLAERISRLKLTGEE